MKWNVTFKWLYGLTAQRVDVVCMLYAFYSKSMFYRGGNEKRTYVEQFFVADLLPLCLVEYVTNMVVL